MSSARACGSARAFAGVRVNSNTLALGIPDFPDLSPTQGNTDLHLGVWNNWLLDDGVYGTVSFRF